MLVESAQSIGRGTIGYVNKDLKVRQAKVSEEVAAYANKANTRLRKKYKAMIFDNKKTNVAKTAIARELACFIWGMMTNHIDFKIKSTR